MLWGFLNSQEKGVGERGLKLNDRRKKRHKRRHWLPDWVWMRRLKHRPTKPALDWRLRRQWQLQRLGQQRHHHRL